MSSCGASEPFALQVLGSEMEPEFHNGHIIVIDPGGTIKDGCYVVAITGPNKDEYIFRQLFIEGENYILRASEPGHAEILLNNVHEDVVGVISQRSSKRRSEHKRYDL
ncbi:MAG: S24 family peptidase [Gammaproteobacteria bacterium]|nr:S24 family peptidase [Gammaproteobacteria bacterium]